MRIFVFAKTCFEIFYPLVLLIELLLQLIDFLVFPLAFLLKFFDPLLKLKQPRKELFFGEIVGVH